MTEEGRNYDWVFPVLAAHGLPRPNVPLAEIGSRDARDAVSLATHFGTNVYCFEADPQNVPACEAEIRANGSSPGSQVSLFPFALSDTSGPVLFHQVDKQALGDAGSSSFFELNFSRRPANDPFRNHTSVQREIVVQSVRFDELGLPPPSAIFMDVEGAELKVLQGFGELLGGVDSVVLEASFWRNHYGQAATFPQIDRFLWRSGFSYIGSRQWGSSKPRNPIRRQFFPRYQPSFDVVFIRKV